VWRSAYAKGGNHVNYYNIFISMKLVTLQLSFVFFFSYCTYMNHSVCRISIYAISFRSHFSLRITGVHLGSVHNLFHGLFNSHRRADRGREAALRTGGVYAVAYTCAAAYNVRCASLAVTPEALFGCDKVAPLRAQALRWGRV